MVFGMFIRFPLVLIMAAFPGPSVPWSAFCDLLQGIHLYNGAGPGFHHRCCGGSLRVDVDYR